MVIDHDAERAWAEIVTANYFDVLGVRMTLGRGFIAAEEEHAGQPGTAVVSHEYWRRSTESTEGQKIRRQIFSWSPKKQRVFRAVSDVTRGDYIGWPASDLLFGVF